MLLPIENLFSNRKLYIYLSNLRISNTRRAEIELIFANKIHFFNTIIVLML